MASKPEQSNTNPLRKNTTYYNGAIIFIAIIFCIVTSCFCWRMFAPRPQVNQIELKMLVSPDSISIPDINSSHRALADSISNLINKQDKELNEHYQLFLKAREDDADLIKILSYIAAFMAAVFTIIGIKSFKDLRDRVEENTKELARQTAIDTARLHIKSDIQTEIRESLKDDIFFRDIKNRVIESINRDHLVALEERISKIEGNSDINPREAHISERSSMGDELEVDAPLPQDDNE